jgi:hypothetical protein
MSNITENIVSPEALAAAENDPKRPSYVPAQAWAYNRIKRDLAIASMGRDWLLHPEANRDERHQLITAPSTGAVA